jgi:hypothetical protein
MIVPPKNLYNSLKHEESDSETVNDGVAVRDIVYLGKRGEGDKICRQSVYPGHVPSPFWYGCIGESVYRWRNIEGKFLGNGLYYA